MLSKYEIEGDHHELISLPRIGDLLEVRIRHPFIPNLRDTVGIYLELYTKVHIQAAT